MINKLKPFKHKPDNIEDCQMEADQIPEEDLDGEGVKPIVEPQDSKAREGFVQCVERQPTVEETEDLGIHEEKDGDWGGGIQLSSAGAS